MRSFHSCVNSKESAVNVPLSGICECVTVFLGAIDRKNTCGDKAAVRHEILSQFVENLVRVASGSLGQSSGDAVSCHLANGDMRAPFNQIVHPAFICGVHV